MPTVLTVAGQTPTLAATAFVAETATVVGNVTLADDASVWYGSVLRAEHSPITVGADTNIPDNSVVHTDPGFATTLGDRVTVGHRVILHGCTVGDECLIGMGSVLLNHVKVGTGSVVAAGAVLPEGMEVPPRSLVMGIPARLIRPVDDRLARRIESTWSHYVEQARAHRAGRFPLYGA